jgi:hypothetical protein
MHSLLSHGLHMPFPARRYTFDHLNNTICEKHKSSKLHIMQFSSTFRYKASLVIN